MSNKPRLTYAELLNQLGSIVIGERQYLFEFLDHKANEDSELDAQIIWQRLAPRYAKSASVDWLFATLAAKLRQVRAAGGPPFGEAPSIEDAITVQLAIDVLGLVPRDDEDDEEEDA